MTWTPEQDAYIRCYYGDRPTWGIAYKLGRSEGAIQVRAQRLGLCYQRLTDEQKQTIADNPDMPADELANLAGCSPRTIRRDRRQL